MKCVGLDSGDVWTGIALSDALQMFARPYSTVQTKELVESLQELFKKEQIATVIVGYPKTMRGTTSDQTKSVQTMFEQLQALFVDTTWILWDERLSSRRAEQLKKTQTHQDKKASHAVAAAFILTSYLDYRAFSRADDRF